MSLYKILGVPTNATKDEIKRAYRRKANVHHPDKGGDPAKMVQLVAAYSILFDDEKRRRYDSGESAESISKATMSEDQQVFHIVIGIFMQAVAQADVNNQHIPKLVKEQIRANIKGIEVQIKSAPAAIERFESVKKRLTVKKTNAENPFITACDQGIAQIHARIADLKQQKELGKKAAQFLDAFDYEVDQQIINIQITI